MSEITFTRTVTVTLTDRQRQTLRMLVGQEEVDTHRSRIRAEMQDGSDHPIVQMLVNAERELSDLFDALEAR
jgi:hypothetical protein